MNAEAIANWIKQRTVEAKAKGIVVGLSGGVDSAVVLALSVRALGRGVLGVLMPCETNPGDMDDAKAHAQQLGVETEEVVLDNVYHEFLSVLPANRTDLALANLKPRLRMTTLYFCAASRNYLVAGTGNRTEIAVGYYTKYGDGGVDILPIGGLLKREVRALAVELKVPRPIIEKAPSAGLWPGQTDEGEIGMSYDTLDEIVDALQSGRKPKAEAEQVARVQALMRASEHKRSLPPICPAK